VQKEARGEVVAVIKLTRFFPLPIKPTPSRFSTLQRLLAPFAITLCFLTSPTLSSVLPEDRADVLYHSYDGGGVTISGPSILVRKGFKEKYSASANYYVDKVSSASIDVVSTASKYTEERTEYSVGIDYLENKTTLSSGFGNSSENDYEAETFFFNFSQDFFGDLSTLSLGFSQGSDDVMKTGDANFLEHVDRKNYKLSLTQIISKNFIANLSFETITDQGFLNNPYRSVRFLTVPNGTNHDYQNEQYPNTRTSDAFALKGIYYLPYRAALKMEYRYFSDSWDIKANTFGVEYRHPFKNHWLAEFRVRQYSQNKADFYSDLFDFKNAQEFLARDKELSTFSSLTLGATLSYERKITHQRFIDRTSVTLGYDYISFDYDNFREINLLLDSGTEPLYSFSANVIRFYFSAWY